MTKIDTKTFKKQYEGMFYIVRNELNKVDPMGLAPGKYCPIDEYDPETTMVLTKIKNGIDYIELSKSIGLIFDEMFGEEFSESMFYGCSKNILEKVNELWAI